MDIVIAFLSFTLSSAAVSHQLQFLCQRLRDHHELFLATTYEEIGILLLSIGKLNLCCENSLELHVANGEWYQVVCLNSESWSDQLFVFNKADEVDRDDRVYVQSWRLASNRAIEEHLVFGDFIFDDRNRNVWRISKWKKQKNTNSRKWKNFCTNYSSLVLFSLSICCRCRFSEESEEVAVAGDLFLDALTSWEALQCLALRFPSANFFLKHILEKCPCLLQKLHFKRLAGHFKLPSWLEEPQLRHLLGFGGFPISKL